MEKFGVAVESFKLQHSKYTQTCPSNGYNVADNIMKTRGSWFQPQEIVSIFKFESHLLYEKSGDGWRSSGTALSFQGMCNLHIHQSMILNRTCYIQFTHQNIASSCADGRMKKKNLLKQKNSHKILHPSNYHPKLTSLLYGKKNGEGLKNYLLTPVSGIINAGSSSQLNFIVSRITWTTLFDKKLNKTLKRKHIIPMQCGLFKTKPFSG